MCWCVLYVSDLRWKNVGGFVTPMIFQGDIEHEKHWKAIQSMLYPLLLLSSAGYSQSWRRIRCRRTFGFFSNVFQPSELWKIWKHRFRALKTVTLILLCNLLETPGVKERKLAGWRLSRGKAWKGSLNATEKKRPPNGSQHGHHGGRALAQDVFFLHAVSEGDQANPNGMVAGKPQNCVFYLGFTAL